MQNKVKLTPCSPINVNNPIGLKPRNESYIREFNKGKSFEYTDK